MKVEIIDPKFLNDGKGKEWKKGDTIELGKGQTKEAIERGFVKQIDNEKKNKTIPTKKVLKRKKKTKEKAYTGKGQIRVKLDLTKEKDLKQCFHYKNLQPLWDKDNMKKHDKIIDGQMSLTI